jgi:hypothetical protein
MKRDCWPTLCPGSVTHKPRFATKLCLHCPPWCAGTPPVSKTSGQGGKGLTSWTPWCAASSRNRLHTAFACTPWMLMHLGQAILRGGQCIYIWPVPPAWCAWGDDVSIDTPASILDSARTNQQVRLLPWPLQIHDDNERTVVKALHFGRNVCAAEPAACHPVASRSGLLTKVAECLTGDNIQLQSAALSLLHQLADNQRSVDDMRNNRELTERLSAMLARLHAMPPDDKESMSEEIQWCSDIKAVLNGESSDGCA